MIKTITHESNTPPILIAGPCSAENKDQLFKTAIGLKNIKINYFRAGIWKPRTRPGEFEGVGNIGLSWLQEIKTLYGYKTATEVANVKHVYDALKSGIDMLWIGARTTTNPFSVQEIAEALKGVSIPVMVKNPINPDLKLWIGALERLYNNNITNLSAIHRGFSIYEKIDYRNSPNWQIVIDLKHEIPDIPIICDPSHIGGKAIYIKEISQKAMDLNYDGLIIETHFNPPFALTDSEQQITPDHLKKILSELIIRKRNEIIEEELDILRQEINMIDTKIINLITHRMDISKKIGIYKKHHNMAIFQNTRWKHLFKKNLQLAREKKLSENFVSALFKFIHQESISIQERIFSDNNNETQN